MRPKSQTKQISHRRRSLDPYTTYTCLHRPAGVAGTVLSASPPCPPLCPMRQDLLWPCVFCPADTTSVCVSRTPGARRAATLRRSSLIGSQAVAYEPRLRRRLMAILAAPEAFDEATTRVAQELGKTWASCSVWVRVVRRDGFIPGRQVWMLLARPQDARRYQSISVLCFLKGFLKPAPS